MNGPARLVLAAIFSICASNHAFAQSSVQPAPDPIVTAQNDAWYLGGEPVTFEGNIYYPAGPQAYFNRYEMVRSGAFRGVPLYTRTTIEPYSVVFVPIGNGLMQPYERRRAGDVAGTAGSAAPSFPGLTAAEQGTASPALSPDALQAPAPPTVTTAAMPAESPRTIAPPRATEPRPVATSGTIRRPAVARRPFQSAVPSTGLNGVYVDFERTRYFSAGPAVLLDRGGFERIGERDGLPVYMRKGEPNSIYVPVQQGADLLAHYASGRAPRSAR